MYEVKVYDNSGKLKKVISEKALIKRSTHMLTAPADFRKGKKVKTPVKAAKKSS